MKVGLYAKESMANRRVAASGASSDSTIRASISFPKDQYIELDRIAQQQRVSLAWVVRDAIEEYLKNRWPLFQLDSSEQRK
jgi:metal-responsive CopG/Arc/MetJ family transcriptional regulator